MSSQIEDIVIPILRNMQSDIATLKESVRRIDGRLTSMDHHLAGFYSEQRWQNDEIDTLRGRLEDLENQPDPNSSPE